MEKLKENIQVLMWSGFHQDELEGDLETKRGIHGKYIYGQVGDKIHSYLIGISLFYEMCAVASIFGSFLAIALVKKIEQSINQLGESMINFQSLEDV